MVGPTYDLGQTNCLPEVYSLMVYNFDLLNRHFASISSHGFSI